jgi:hypothetical protein
MKKLIKLFETLLFILFLILIIFTKSKLTVLITIPVLILIYLFVKKVKIKNYYLFLFILAFIIRIISIIYLKVDITDDYKTMLDASKELIKGNLSFLNTFYFKRFSYQLGHVLYQALLLKIFNKVIFLKIVNSIITSLIVVFIYLISKNLFKETTARIISLGYIFYLYPLYLNSVLTNQHLPALIVLIILYLIITKKSTTKLSIIIAILLSISNIFRTESIIFILGITIYNLIKITKSNYKSIIKNTSIMIIVYLICNLLVSNILLLTPLNTKLENKASLWKFYCGLNYEYNGIYNEEDQDVFFNTSNQKELLVERIKEENYKLPILFLKKEVILWTQTNYDLRITNNMNQSIYNFLLNFNQGYLNIIILLFVISLFPYKDLKNDKILLIKIILGLYVCIYALIEISPRYAYILHILVFLILGISLEKITNFLKNRISKKLI